MTTELDLDTEIQNETLEPSLVAVPSSPSLRGKSIWLTTFYNQRLLNMKPEAGPIELPSFYQIGDAVEFALQPEGGETEIFSAVVYAVKFSGNGAVSYDLAVPVNGSAYFTVITDIRDGLRKAGSDDDFNELLEITPKVKSEIASKIAESRRSQIHPV